MKHQRTGKQVVSNTTPNATQANESTDTPNKGFKAMFREIQTPTRDGPQSGADPSTANSSSSTIGKTRKSSPPPPHSLDDQAETHDNFSRLPPDTPPVVSTWIQTLGSSPACSWVPAPPPPTVEVTQFVAQACATNESSPSHLTAPPPPATQIAPQTPSQVLPVYVTQAPASGTTTIDYWDPFNQPGSSLATIPGRPFPSLSGQSQGFDMPHGSSQMQSASLDTFGAGVVQGGLFHESEQHPQTHFHSPSGPVVFPPSASEADDLDAAVHLFTLGQAYQTEQQRITQMQQRITQAQQRLTHAQRLQEVRLRRIAHLEAQQNSRGALNIQEPTQLPPPSHNTSDSLPHQWMTTSIEQQHPLQPQPHHSSTSATGPLYIQQARQPYSPISHPSPSSLGPSSPYSSSYPSSPASHVPFTSFPSPASSSSAHSFSPVPVSPSASSPSTFSDQSSSYNDPRYRDPFHGGSPGSSYISASFDSSRPPTRSPSAALREFELPD
ncbi:hypothetical protein AAF712_006220 [Marasmius tenuissimus]|uniref:Uncharacterized protein n=1 Tax=Marasmius tenuissimus TaxID=585030 RepID=A0ABR3A198_9AGAR